MGRNLLTATFDAATELKDAGAITASGAGRVGGALRVVNVGNAFLQAVMIVDFVSYDIAGGDEKYEILLQGSSDPTFASDVTNLARVQVGAGIGEDTSPISRRSIPFINESEDQKPLPYLRAFANVTAGAGTASINYRAFITKNPTNG